MKLVIALGNPGEKYHNTRHNIGFMTADKLTDNLEGSWHEEAVSLVYHTQVNGGKVLIAKPQTYMNRTGNTAKTLINKYDLNIDNVTLIYDDIDLPFSDIRVRQSGGTGGHKGVESIVEKIGSNSFVRIRIGIGRPQDNTKIEDYVLQNFTPEEKKEVAEITKKAAQKTRLLLKFGYEKFASKYNA